MSPAAPRQAWLPLAVVLQLGLAVYPFGATGLLAPAWGVAAAYVLWAAAAAWLVHVRRRGALPLLAPVASLALWLALLTVGDLALGWTA